MFATDLYRGPCKNKYEHLVPIYNTCIQLELPDGDAPRSHTFKSSAWSKYGGGLLRDMSYKGVLPTKANVWKSIFKMDVDVVKDIEFPELWEQSEEHLYRLLEPLVDPSIIEDPEFVPSSSSGFPFNQLGFKTKSELLSQPWFAEYIFNPFDKINWWRFVPKHEYLGDSDIFENKIRTFLPSPCHLLYWQKVFFGNQDEALKKHHPGGIQYGISFQYGGFDELIRSHYIAHGLDPIKDIDKLVFVEADISGWDRHYAMMDEVYRIRSSLVKVPAYYQKYFDWTVENTKFSELLLPNGDVVRKVGASNNSGSGCTTGDNCLGHKLIDRYFDLCLFKKLGKTITTHVSIYGDDILKSFPLEALPILETGFMRDVYKQFNLIIKESAYKVQIGCLGSCFLGASVALVDGHFVPAYKSDRIYAAMTTNIDKPFRSMDLEASKYYSLLMLSWNDRELFDALRSLLCKMVQSETGPFLDSLKNSGIPFWDDVVFGFWLNYESVDKVGLEGFKMINELNHFRLPTFTPKCLQNNNFMRNIKPTGIGKGYQSQNGLDGTTTT